LFVILKSLSFHLVPFAVLIQSQWRANVEEINYQGQRASAIHIGRLFRGCLARRKYISKRNRFHKNQRHWNFMCGSLVLRRKRHFSRQVKHQYMVQKKRRQQQRRQVALHLQGLYRQRQACRAVGILRKKQTQRQQQFEEAAAVEAAAVEAAAVEAAALLATTTAPVPTTTTRGPARVAMHRFTSDTVDGHISYEFEMTFTTLSKTVPAPPESSHPETKTDHPSTTSTVKGGMRTRYSEVRALHHALCRTVGAEELPAMPPKTWCQRSDMGFLERRSRLLETYLNELLASNNVVRSAPMRSFFSRVVRRE
jgi:hypothetical protein